MLLVEGWEQLDLPAMRTSLTWWHGDQNLKSRYPQSAGFSTYCRRSLA
jgi:hypothetical protein